METYQFYLDLTPQSPNQKCFSRIVTCEDPSEDGLDRFTNDIIIDGRFLPIEDDITYKKL